MSKINPKLIDDVFDDSVLDVLPTNEKINKGVGNAKQAEKLKGRIRKDQSERMSGKKNVMAGKISPNRGKEMPQISEKIKGKTKPAGFGEKVSKKRKELGLGNTWGGKKRPEHSLLMKSKPNKGLDKTRTKWSCEHCQKEGVGSSNYVRWHGDNCKMKGKK
jgi:hypothetical protein